MWRHQCDLEKYNFNIQVKYFIPLSKNDLDHIARNYDIEPQSELRQETSGWSILMRDNKFYYKILPLSSDNSSLERLCEDCSKTEKKVLSERQYTLMILYHVKVTNRIFRVI